LSTAEIHTLDSAYMIEFGHVPDGFRVKDLSGDTSPHTYKPPYTTYLYYYTAYGVWRCTTGNGKWEFSSNKGGRDYRPTIIRKCEIPQHDDMVDAFGYAVTANEDVEKEVKQATEWYKRTQGVDFANPLQPKVKFTGIKEVKRKMGDKALFHVILFNRKTEVIDFKGYIPAVSETDACMLAAQTYGKYDSNIHVRVVKHITEYKVKD